MCLDRYPGGIPLRGSAQCPQREGMGIQWGSSSSVKSLTCSDLARRDQRNFHHDTDYTHRAGRRDDLVILRKKIKP